MSIIWTSKLSNPEAIVMMNRTPTQEKGLKKEVEQILLIVVFHDDVMDICDDFDTSIFV